MNRDQTEGKGKDMKGRMKEAAGDLTGNERLKNEGAADQAEGKVQNAWGKGKERIGEAMNDAGKRLKR